MSSTTMLLPRSDVVKINTVHGERYFVSRREWLSAATRLTRFSAQGRRLGRLRGRNRQFVPFTPVRRECVERVNGRPI